MPSRDPETGQFLSGGNPGGIVHRAHVIARSPEGGGDQEPHYTFQAPDTDRRVVGTLTQHAGDEPAGFEVAELSFDGNAAFVVGADEPEPGDADADDTRSSVLHVSGHRWDTGADGGLSTGQTGAQFTPQNAKWRRGTELFLHTSTGTALDEEASTVYRAIVYYVEED